MGRVREAMQRATGREAPVAEAPEATSLAVEAFPGEATSGGTPDTRGANTTPASPTPPETASAGDAGLPELTRYLRHDQTLATKVVLDDRMAPSAREQYRKLAAACHHAQETSGLKVVMIASAVASEGKSLTASNLALTLSESYRRRVLLVDADLRRPSLGAVFGIPAGPGLTEALTATEEPRLSVYDLSPRLTLLPAGQPTSDPMAGLTSSRMRSILAEARERFDWVIIDTPPVGALTDASLLAAMVDAAVIVIKAGATPYQLVQRAVAAIGRERLLGAVLNRATELAHGASYEYYHYYHAPKAGGGRG